MVNLEHWNALCRPPEGALKQIKGGRLKGMTDINPQWRYKVMTEHFGPVGIGWAFEIVRTWCEGATDEVCAFAEIKLFIKHDGEWSQPIPGMGGSKLLAQETNGRHVSDECFKMAVTDALSVAMKTVGVAADIYAGFFDGSKYTVAPPNEQHQQQQQQQPDPKQDDAAFKAAEKLLSAKQQALAPEQLDWCIANIQQFPQDVIDYLNKF